ncbi:hypothetical protein TNCV_2004691 [Trichonephila clavipes]|nr:hypothetical protein TNCV_2004691 [Trichonephila clavipes]
MACERKLIESEATTGFFVLLGTKGKKETLEWCMKANLIASRYECPRFKKKYAFCSQLASLDKNNALQEIKLRLSYLQGKSTTMSVFAHQTEKEWISANEKSRQRMSQTQAEGAAKQHAARLEEAHLQAHHSCFTSERC